MARDWWRPPWSGPSTPGGVTRNLTENLDAAPEATDPAGVLVSHQGGLVPQASVFLSSLISSRRLGAELPAAGGDGTWEQRAARWLTVTPFRKAVNAKGSTKDTSTFTWKR